MDTPRLSSALREDPRPDGTPGPWSFRRLSAAFLFLLAPEVLVGSAFLARAVLPDKAPALVWVAVILGPFAFCLALGALMPVLTTAESIQGVIAAATGKSKPVATGGEGP